MAKKFRGTRKCDWCDNLSTWRGRGMSSGAACDAHKKLLDHAATDDEQSEGEQQAMGMFGI